MTTQLQETRFQLDLREVVDVSTIGPGSVIEIEVGDADPIRIEVGENREFTGQVIVEARLLPLSGEDPSTVKVQRTVEKFKTHVHKAADLSDFGGGTPATGDYWRYSGTIWDHVAISQVLTDLLTVDGPGSGLDADLLDGVQESALLRADGSRALTADWDAGPNQIRAETFQSDVATGTAPFVVASTTKVTNLNADLLDGVEEVDLIRKDGSRAFTGNVDFGSNKGVNVATPAAGTDAVNKDYVDSKIQGLDWQESVIDKDLSTPPGTPSTGDRYIVAASATGDWTGQEEKIAEWDGSAWVFTTPDEGTAVMVEDENRVYLYDDAHPTGTWIVFGGVVDHGALLGLNDDDHPQYLLIDGTRAMTGDLDMGTNAITNVGNVDGVDVSGHASRHLSGGADSIKLDDLASPDDNTDLDVSTSAHGLVPKAPNDATKYLDGTGAWSVPAGGGGSDGWVPIETITASNDATIDFETSIDSTYKAYKIIMSKVVPATDAVNFFCRIGTGGTPTYQSGASDYGWAHVGHRNGGSWSRADTSDDEIELVANIGNGLDVGSAAGEGVSGELTLFDPADTTIHGYLMWQLGLKNSGANEVSVTGTGSYKSTTAITAIRLYFSSGNVESGVFTLYGLASA